MSKMDKRQLLRYIGDTSQLFGIDEFTFTSGKARGMRAYNVRNGSGLEFMVLADRCMDIGRISFKGLNIAYMTPVGITAPQYYERKGFGFLRSFSGGGLTTCGFTSVGLPCVDNGEELGLHGVATSLPAENLGSKMTWEDTPKFEVSGRMRQSVFFSENIILDRSIRSELGDNSIKIHDLFTNDGFKTQPLMVLYHINIGYPILQVDSYMLFATGSFKGVDEVSEKNKNSYEKCQDPEKGYQEQVFFHKMKGDKTGRTVCAIINPKLDLGVAVWSNVKQLDRVTQWKMFEESSYVVGLEPTNAHGFGRDKARSDRTLQFIDPGEKKDVDIRIEVLEGKERINEIKEICEKIKG